MRFVVYALAILASVNVYGQVCIGTRICYHVTADGGCAHWGGVCNQGGGGQTYQRQPTVGEIIYQAGQDAERNAQIQNEQNQRQLQIDRSQTHPRLLPLVPSNTAISRETQGVIFSTLQRSLEMDAGGTETNWRNSNTGATGEIKVFSESKNRYGDICRDFSVSLYYSVDKQTRSINGTACRSNGRWNLL